MQNPQEHQSDLLSSALYPIGGEPLAGSGFEAEEPESEFLTSEIGGEE